MRQLLLVSTWFIVSCASTKAAQGGTEPAAPDAGPSAQKEDDGELRARLEAMFQRESEPGPQVTFTLKDKALAVESSQVITVARQDNQKTSTVTIGVGASTPMTCTLFDQPFDVGALVSRTLANIKAKLQLTQVRPSSIEVVEKAPAVFLVVGYAVDGEAGRMVGELKLMAYANDEAPLYCVFDEPGYTQSFHRVASATAASLARAFAKPGDAATFRTVDITRIQGTPVGFGATQWRKSKDGTATIASRGAMLVPRTPVDWLTTDQATFATLAKDGTVKEKRFVVLANGAVDRDLVLTRSKAGTYRYSGTVQGKALEGVLTTQDKKDLASDIISARRIKKELLSGKKAELRLEDYVPDANPAALTSVTVRKEAGPNDVTMEVGPMKLETTVDASGVTERVTLHAGPVSIIEERAFVEGVAE